eukprot:GFUD01036059.1.p1 GENE.GFUD01036059.1~~GFUD01036059.1.p1  ORF type:complete len:492 (+),score=135.53 GFUD01036059.1:206-1681(+)
METHKQVEVKELSELIEKSREFGKLNRFGSTNTTCEKLLERGFEEKVLLENANSSYPIVHYKVLKLMENFLELKIKYGSKIEKRIYDELSITAFVDRLLAKRPLVFVGQRDTYILRDGKKEGCAYDEWHKIGTDKEEDPFIMEDYLTYDEGKLAALLGASTKTININKGDRRNCGEYQQGEEYEKEGVIVGLVGPRMNKSNALESQEMRVKEDQNIPENGYGGKGSSKSVLKLFADFYGIKYLPTFKEVESSYRKSRGEEFTSEKIWNVFTKKVNSNVHEEYEEISGLKNSCQFLHISAYKQRNRIAAEILLAEASDRANKLGKRAYVHVVGLGLGVWRIYNRQIDLFTTGFVEAVAEMNLEAISDLDLSWVIIDDKKEVKFRDTHVVNGHKIPGTNTVLHISKRNPWDKLQEEDKVVVASWAWDGLSFVGNEYWAGSLATSSDPAAAACTQIPELLNPWVNQAFCGENVRVVTQQGRIVPYRQFQADCIK